MCYVVLVTHMLLLAKTDGGSFDDREHSTEVVFLLGLAPGTLGLSQLIGQLAPQLQ